MATRDQEFAPTNAQIGDLQRAYRKRVVYVENEIQRLFDELKGAERRDPQEWFAILREAERLYRNQFPPELNRSEVAAYVDGLEGRQRKATLKYGPDDLDGSILNISRNTRAELIENQLDAMRALIDRYLSRIKQEVKERKESGVSLVAAATVAAAISKASSVSESRAEFYGKDQAGEIHRRVTGEIHTKAGARRYEWLRTTSKNPRDRHLKRVGSTFRYDAPIDHPGDLPNCKCGRRPIFD